jgi:Phage integrase family
MGFEGRSLLPIIGQLSAGDINESECAAYIKPRTDMGRKPGTIWTELGRLRSALRWAEKKGLIDRAPAIYRPPMSPPRDLRLTREQAQTFLDACEMPHVRLFVILAMTTGARMGAILGLTWNRVDFERQTIDLNEPGRTMTNKRRAAVLLEPERPRCTVRGPFWRADALYHRMEYQVGRVGQKGPGQCREALRVALGYGACLPAFSGLSDGRGRGEHGADCGDAWAFRPKNDGQNIRKICAGFPERRR